MAYININSFFVSFLFATGVFFNSAAYSLTTTDLEGTWQLTPVLEKFFQSAFLEISEINNGASLETIYTGNVTFDAFANATWVNSSKLVYKKSIHENAELIASASWATTNKYEIIGIKIIEENITCVKPLYSLLTDTVTAEKLKEAISLFKLLHSEVVCTVKGNKQTFTIVSNDNENLNVKDDESDNILILTKTNK